MCFDVTAFLNLFLFIPVRLIDPLCDNNIPLFQSNKSHTIPSRTTSLDSRYLTSTNRAASNYESKTLIWGFEFPSSTMRLLFP